MTADDHGSASTYTNHACRCTDCRAAWAEYFDRRRQQRRKAVQRNGLPASVEHNDSAYTNWGCRCDICTTAHRTRKARK